MLRTILKTSLCLVIFIPFHVAGLLLDTRPVTERPTSAPVSFVTRSIFSTNNVALMHCDVIVTASVSEDNDTESESNRVVIRKTGSAVKSTVSKNDTLMVFSIPRDCQDYLWEGFRENKLYTIYPQKSGRLDVFCDQVTDGGGWTVIQRRSDGSEDFFRNWIDYKYGFGNKSNEFWLGNHRIYEIASQGFYELRIDMTDFAGESRYAVYKRFSIGDERSGYKLTIEDYQGTAGDSMIQHNGAQFYTKDHDSNSCAATFKGGWWYTNCHVSNLNGLYLRGAHSTFADGIEWKAWHGYNYSLKFTEMKIRRL